MSLKPWLPVPMIPTVIRLLGATAPKGQVPYRVSRVGKANTAAVAGMPSSGNHGVTIRQRVASWEWSLDLAAVLADHWAKAS